MSEPEQPHGIMMKGARLLLRGRWLALAALAGLTVAGSFYARQLSFDFGIQKFFPDDSPLREPYLAAEEIFGRDDARVLVAFELPDLFEAQGMAHLRSLTDAMAAIDGVADATSVANVTRIRAETDGIVVEPLVAEDADTQALAEARAVLADDPLLRGLYVNQWERDGVPLTVAIVVEYGVPRTEAARRREIGRAIEGVLAKLGRPGVSYYQAGIPHTRNIYAQAMFDDNRTVIPGIALGLMLILAFIYRRPVGVLLPMTVVGIALSWTAAITVLMDRPLNIITNVVIPVVLVVGMADSIHILNAYREAFVRCGDKMRALEETLAEMAVACFLTSFTTAVGFGVLVLTSVPILREFGFISAVGVMASYVTTVVGLPIVLSFLKPLVLDESRGLGAWVARRLMGLSHVVNDHRWRIVAVAVAVIVVGGLSATGIQRDARVLEDLREDHPEYVARHFIEARFGGGMPIAVLVRGEADDFRDPENVAALAKVADAMTAEKYVRAPVGLHSIVTSLHRALAPEHPESLPTSRPLLAQELLLYEMSGDDRLEEVVSGDFSAARVLGRSADAMTSEVDAMRERLERAGRAAFASHLRVDVSSTMVLAQWINRTLVSNMASSFVTAFVVIFLTMLLMFRSASLAALALIPNVAPLLLLVGFMAVTGIHLKVSTAFIFAIAFGIAVDDTIHFLARVRRERALGRDREEAVHAAIAGTGRAIVQTTVVLVLGFSLLLTSDFLVNVNFGLLCGVTLTAAVVADLTLLPALLLIVRRW